MKLPYLLPNPRTSAMSHVFNSLPPAAFKSNDLTKVNAKNNINSSSFDTCPSNLPSIDYDVDGQASFISLTSSCVTAVSVRSAVKAKSGHKILDGLNMNVPVGKIYGLLGPSGSGKTTLLRCIVGCDSLDSGSICVFGYEPGTSGSGIPGSGCGFMPQEIALDVDLTVRETLAYFARLHNLSERLINERTEWLLSLLDLSVKFGKGKDCMVKNLSGGQKRRVSLAAALIHKPRLVILDEPTVGVDPVLRERIWKSLVALTKHDKLTVIVTTHYIEETSRADTVAFLRHGRLLAESSPRLLMETLGQRSLESVFFTLASTQAQLKSFHPSEYLHPHSLPPASVGSDGCWSKSLTMWLMKLICVSQKVQRQTFRQCNHLGLQFLLPLVSLLLFCCCIGTTPSDITIGVVNHESPALLSALFLQEVDSSVINLIYYGSREDASNAVANQQIWGYMYFDGNFSESLIRRAHFQESPNPISNETIRQSTIFVHADVTNKVLAVTMMRSLESSYMNFLRSTLLDLDYNPRLAEAPIKIGYSIYGSASGRDYFALRDYGIPGFLVVLTYSSSFAASVLSLVSRERGDLMDRNAVCGVTAAHIVTAQIAARLPALLVSSVALLTLAITLFSVPIQGSIGIALALLLLQSVAGLTHGLVVSAFCSGSFFSAMVASNFLLLAMFILSGALWPLDALPHFLRPISSLQPTTAATIALRSVLARGSGLGSACVLQGLVFSLCWICAFFAASITLFRLK